MLEDLFSNNQLEYVHIKTWINANMVRPTTFSYNIKNLRYFYIDNAEGRVDIILDIQYAYPNKLYVYIVQHINYIHYFPGKIKGLKY